MTGTKLGVAYKEYNETNRNLVHWIIGLTMGEIALVLNEQVIVLEWLFAVFFFSAIVTIVFAIIIMYVIVANADIELISAIISEKYSHLSESEFEKTYNDRFGNINRILTDFMIEKKAYRFLVLFFLISTITSISIFVVTKFNFY